jgi:hypothetical protein
MPKLCYVPKRFTPEHEHIIEQANGIIEEYMPQGFRLTLRQLYYQFVARGLLKNKVTEYKRLGSIINDARLAGQIDWEVIEDRTRNLQSPSVWSSPGNIIDACASSFNLDKWHGQERRIEVWIEKEALAGVFKRACDRWDVPFFSCRGYTSQSEMWVGAMRLHQYARTRQTPLVLHFGDHDPSGIDMTRDIRDRMATFGLNLDLQRLALNMDQVEEHNPPPNPAKTTDSRYEGYIAHYGYESWELDALEPAVLERLVSDTIRANMDMDKWEAKCEEVERDRMTLNAVADRWIEVQEYLAEND